MIVGQTEINDEDVPLADIKLDIITKAPRDPVRRRSKSQPPPTYRDPPAYQKPRKKPAICRLDSLELSEDESLV